MESEIRKREKELKKKEKELYKRTKSNKNKKDGEDKLTNYDDENEQKEIDYYPEVVDD